MDIFDLFRMIGGLALFLFGMQVMEQGLNKIAGGRMQSLLASMTTNPVKAILLGAAVTAVVQSSSATTVMVVGFVNSSIMDLNQAVGIIMGANIGTTITSWILSLTGIQSDNFWLQMLEPTSFAPILGIIGVFVMMFSKNDRRKGVGSILIAFSVLMFGMDTMSDAVSPLADIPAFQQLFLKFTNPILGVLVGAALTAVIQSSAASIGILQAFALSGIVTYGSAVPIIMGQNIGTCVTALLSSIGASKNGKRAAMIHLYFNIIGTIVFMILFYGIMYISGSTLLAQNASLTGIAIVHTSFNIIATLLLAPFRKLIVRLAKLTIKDETPSAEENILPLDIRFLDTPGYAIAQCREQTIKMAHITKESMLMAISLLFKYDQGIVNQVAKMEDIIDKYEDELGTYLVKLSGKDLQVTDSRTMNILLHLISDFERISDHALNISESAQELHSKGLSFSEEAKKELTVYSDAVKEILNNAIDAFERDDIDGAKEIEPLEEVIDYLSVTLRNNHVKRLREGTCSIELGFILADLINNFERVADHCSNIGVCIIEVGADEFQTHSYIAAIKEDRGEDFTSHVEQYSKKYAIKS